MAKSTSRITATTALPKFRKQLHAAARTGIERGSAVGAQVARAGTPRGDGTSGRTPGHAAATIAVMRTQVRARDRGYRAGFGSTDRTIVYLALGTNGRRAKKLFSGEAEAKRKALRATRAGRSGGLRPNPWMRNALVRTALPVAIETMKRRGGGRLL